MKDENKKLVYKLWFLYDGIPTKDTIEISQFNGHVQFWATTGDYDIDELMEALIRIHKGEGGPPRIKTESGVCTANPNAIVLKDKSWEGFASLGDFDPGFRLTLIPKWGGRRVKLVSSVGSNNYNTKKLYKALEALKEAKENDATARTGDR